MSKKKLDALYGRIMASTSRKGGDVFIRFGKWSAGERSRNFVEGDFEEGVSVYPARIEGSDIEIALETVDEPEFLANQLMTNLNFARKENTPIFLVSGRYVGSGESFDPLIRDVRMIRQVSLHDLKSKVMDRYWKGWKS